MLNPAGFKLSMLRAGEPVEWLKSLLCSCYDPTSNEDTQLSCPYCEGKGRVWVSQGLKTAYVHKQKKDILHPDIGFIGAGELTITTLPADMRLGEFDRVVLMSLARKQLAREVARRGTDTLSHATVLSIGAVNQGTVIYRLGTDFAYNRTTHKIVWLTAGPTNIYAVEYLYHPTFWCINMAEQNPRPDGVGGETPQTMLLRLTLPEA